MNKLIMSLLKNKVVASFLQKLILNLHSKAYSLSSIIAINLNDGVHPKHRIMKYKEWFLDHVEDSWVVLDVGCNTGMMPEVMSTKADFVYGIEMEESHILEAKRKRQQKNIEFILADATKYDYTKLRAIDCVTLSNVLEHIEHRVDFLQKLIKQINWNDKKRLLIRVPMIDREWLTIYKKELSVEYRLDKTHFTEFTYIDFVNELERSGIKVIKHDIKFGELYAVCEVK
ncbi:class I SAM-dependent methyltransferase [Vibrio sp. DW001]|uniref:class I SAM-dependent methyltransferase n=1 Tax=Vibrio sp. DW001 TaxID=2912315 RepID=UPI0023B07A56|nr:class I SAM-dependent methyltransferase [Vibrio sp. DW001]WED26880.1 class I SAM-dependent methyltransferase [Vibrio sp. DW001]